MCSHLSNRLPAKIEGLNSRVVTPRSPLTHAWGKPPVVLRCGVGTPPGYSASSSETASVDGVSWYQQLGKGTTTWTAIRPGVNIALTIPSSYVDVGEGAFLVDLAMPIRLALPSR